jgi:hypothetical protein
LRLVDPFLPTRSGFHQPFGIDLEIRQRDWI